jgi:hypothetical protein
MEPVLSPPACSTTSGLEKFYSDVSARWISISVALLADLLRIVISMWKMDPWKTRILVMGRGGIVDISVVGKEVVDLSMALAEVEDKMELH